MRTNPVKAALRAGRTVIGGEISMLNHVEVPRLFAGAGFDFVFIDMEHTPWSLESVAALVQAARAARIVPLVRVPQAEYVWVSRVLDLGAQGIVVPRVNTPEQVRDLVSWVRYPPQGIRGYACTHLQTDGQPVAPEDFIEANSAETLLVIQIERQQALEKLDEMLAVAGVDVACLGYMDLSTDFGIPGQLDHPALVAAVDSIIDVAGRCGIAAGIIHPDLHMVGKWLARGMRFVSYPSDGLLLQRAATEAVQQLRALSQPQAGGRARVAREVL